MKTEQIKSSAFRQKLSKAIYIGLAPALFGAFLWHAFSYWTGAELDEIGEIIGIMIGLSIRYFVKGKSFWFGVIGSLLTIFSIFLGRVLNEINFLLFIFSEKLSLPMELSYYSRKVSDVFYELEFYDIAILIVAIGSSFFLSYYRKFEYE